MDTFLLSTTIGALLVAVATSGLAWTFWRDARLRSDVRVQLLATAAQGYPHAHSRMGRDTLTGATSLFPSEHESPSASRGNRMLAALAPSLATNGNGNGNGDHRGAGALVSGALGTRPMLWVAGALTLLVLVSGLWTLSGTAASSALRSGEAVVGEEPHATTHAGRTSAGVAAPRLELITLTHEQRGDRLLLSGRIRNAADETPLAAVTAVVSLIDTAGATISTTPLPVIRESLAAGDESPFRLDLVAPPAVARYRVSFRTAAGPVPHVDRRPAAIRRTS